MCLREATVNIGTGYKFYLKEEFEGKEIYIPLYGLNNRYQKGVWLNAEFQPYGLVPGMTFEQFGNTLYPTGFHILKDVIDVKTFLHGGGDESMANKYFPKYGNRLVLLKVQYAGVLAEGPDFSSDVFKSVTVNTVVAARMFIVEEIPNWDEFLSQV